MDFHIVRMLIRSKKLVTDNNLTYFNYVLRLNIIFIKSYHPLSMMPKYEGHLIQCPDIICNASNIWIVVFFNKTQNLKKIILP